MLIKLPEKQNKSTDHVLNFMYGHLGSDFINDISCEDVVFGNIGHSGYPVDKVTIIENTFKTTSKLFSSE